MITVRKVQPKDLDMFFEKIRAFGMNEQAVAGLLESFMLVFDGKTLCGLGCGVLSNNACLLHWIQIDEQFRRNRLGTALVKTILNNAELNGAQNAYLYGECKSFATYLKFEELLDKEELQSIKAHYQKIYGTACCHSIYKVDLKDYFRPCCVK